MTSETAQNNGTPPATVTPRVVATLDTPQAQELVQLGAVFEDLQYVLPQPHVDDATVRTLGRIAYGLSGLVDARMTQAQQVVLAGAAAMPREELHQLPQVQEAGD